MELTNHSKKIREVETELRARLVSMGQTNFAKMAGWSDSKVSRLNIQDMAVTFVLLEKVWETSLIREVARQAVEAVMPRNKNARRQPSVLSKYRWNFNNIQRGNYMRNKGFNPPDTHKEVKRLRFLRSIDERTQISFVKVARTELLKAEARALLPSLPKEEGYTFIPNSFLEKLIKEDISVSQFNDVLKVFRQGR